MLKAQPTDYIAAKILSLEVRRSRLHRRAAELKLELVAKRHDLVGLVEELRAQGIFITKVSPEVMRQGEIDVGRILESDLESAVKAASIG